MESFVKYTEKQGLAAKGQAQKCYPIDIKAM